VAPLVAPLGPPNDFRVVRAKEDLDRAITCGDREAIHIATIALDKATTEQHKAHAAQALGGSAGYTKVHISDELAKHLLTLWSNLGAWQHDSPRGFCIAQNVDYAT
jgi:hypothetical protein